MNNSYSTADILQVRLALHHNLNDNVTLHLFSVWCSGDGVM